MKRNWISLLLAAFLIVSVSGQLDAGQKAGKKQKSHLIMKLDASGWGDWFQLFFNNWEPQDVSASTHVVFYAKLVGKGDISTLTVAFADGEKAKESIRVADYAVIGKKWTKVSIPLSAIKDVDFSILKSMVFQRNAGELVTLAIDEVSFTGGPEPKLMWGDAAMHTSMQGTAGTQVEYEILEKGGF